MQKMLPLLDSILIPYHGDHRGLRAMISLSFLSQTLKRPARLVHRIISKRPTVGFKRVWMRGVSEEHIRCDT